jgi:DNA repair protein RecO (recombination protein O)|tara:strand:- start:2553 stop:3257 length:705 start_codon:yes stop_codon:yes gene_type:complete
LIVQTPAIVLKRFPYSDTSVIAHCFTRDYGKVGIMVRGAQRKKSPRSAYFQPANYLETLFYYKQNRNLYTLSKVSFIKNWIHFQDDLKRLSYALATVELVEKTIADHDPHENLFDELAATLSFFHHEETHFNLCFWYFELRLLQQLGFQPHLPEREFPGLMLPDPNAGPNSRQILEYLIHANINDTSFRDDISNQVVTAKDRRVIANYINANLEYHFDSCRNRKSLKILKQLLT